MIRNRNRDRRGFQSFLHYDMATPLSHSTKPCLAGIAQTSRPESTRSLTNLDLKPRHKHFGVSPPLYLGWIRRLEKKLDRLLQVSTSALDGVTLARNVKLETKSNVCIALALNDCRKLLRPFHRLALASF